MEDLTIKGAIMDSIFSIYGVYNVLGYEEGDQRGYLTFTCGKGTFVGVLARYSEEVWFYKLEQRRKVIDND